MHLRCAPIPQLNAAALLNLKQKKIAFGSRRSLIRLETAVCFVIPKRETPLIFGLNSFYCAPRTPTERASFPKQKQKLP